MIYKRILSAVNEHLNSEITARYALNLAKACESKLYICFIAEKGIPGYSFNSAEDVMKRLSVEAEKMDIKVEGIIGTGDPVMEIDRIVRQKGIDIVFASTRREDIERRFYAGTVARNLSLKLSCSVALVRVVHTGRIHPRKILAPLKARVDHIKERAYFIAKMAEGFKSRIFIFHVTRPITSFFHGEMHLTPAQWEKRLPDDISDFIEHIEKYNVEFEKKLSPGAAAKSITIEAASKRHDLIIMGASERSLLSSLIKGNPVEDVLRETPCDLIILKPRHGKMGNRK